MNKKNLPVSLINRSFVAVLIFSEPFVVDKDLVDDLKGFVTTERLNDIKAEIETVTVLIETVRSTGDIFKVLVRASDDNSTENEPIINKNSVAVYTCTDLYKVETDIVAKEIEAIVVFAALTVEIGRVTVSIEDVRCIEATFSALVHATDDN